MKEIIYIPGGNVTKPQGEGNKFLIHCCNNIGAFGAGVALAIAQKWPIVKQKYREWYLECDGLTLGHIQTVQVEKELVVVNIIGQKGIYSVKGLPPIRYGAMRTGIAKVAVLALKHNASVHAPYYMGAALAGGIWEEIEEIIVEELSAKDVQVFLYDYENKRGNK